MKEYKYFGQQMVGNDVIDGRWVIRLDQLWRLTLIFGLR